MKYAALVLFCLGVTGFVSAQERPYRPGVQKMKVTTTVNSSTNTSTDTQVNVHKGLNGTVRTASCGTYIEVTLNGATERFFPTNLNPKMHIDGYTISFDYVDDNTTKFPEGCEINKSVQVNNVQYNTGG
ncbi:hypothetical protein N9355_09855 [Crocinitomicaceae bacterium]|nr:hypothetical protein [Crocinitomicaceae bacterium]